MHKAEIHHEVVSSIEEMLEHIPVPVTVIGSDGRIRSWNSTLAKLTGISTTSALGKPYKAVLTHLKESTKDPVREVLTSGYINEVTQITVTRMDSGKIYQLHAIPISSTGRGLDGVILCFADLTEALEKFQRSQEIQTLRMVASTLAHEVRNPLNAIKGAVVYLQSRLKGDPKTAEFIRIIHSEIIHLNEFVSSFLVAAKPEPPTRVPTDLNGLIHSILSLLRTELGRMKIMVNLQELPLILIDQNQIHRVLINLIRNAIEAMPNGGRLRIQSFWNGDNTVRDAVPVSKEARCPGVTIIIEDSGVGITPSDMSRVGQPFFTTKQKGTGLGLFISKEIMEAHGGRLWHESSPGRGTQAYLFFPLN